MSDEFTPELIDDRRIGRHSQLLPNDATTRTVRPSTVLAALMVQAPGDALQESIEEVQPLLDAIAYAESCVGEEDAFILNAINDEGITYDELADRLGVKRTKGWRMYQQAFKRLRTLLLNHPPIRERLGMQPTWNAAAMEALVDIAGYDESTVPSVTDQRHAAIIVAEAIDNAVKHLNDGRENDAVRALIMAASLSVDYLRSIGKWSLVDEHELLCSKQSDYGHGNILKFGMMGVMVRASDKGERLKNLTRLGGVTARNESLLDTFFDVIGYAVIARMLKAETFELSLEGT